MALHERAGIPRIPDISRLDDEVNTGLDSDLVIDNLRGHVLARRRAQLEFDVVHVDTWANILAGFKTTLSLNDGEAIVTSDGSLAMLGGRDKNGIDTDQTYSTFLEDGAQHWVMLNGNRVRPRFLSDGTYVKVYGPAVVGGFTPSPAVFDGTVVGDVLSFDWYVRGGVSQTSHQDQVDEDQSPFVMRHLPLSPPGGHYPGFFSTHGAAATGTASSKSDDVVEMNVGDTRFIRFFITNIGRNVGYTVDVGDYLTLSARTDARHVFQITGKIDASSSYAVVPVAPIESYTGKTWKEFDAYEFGFALNVGGGGGGSISGAAHNMLKANPDDPGVAAASPGMWSRPVIPLTQTAYNGLGTKLDSDVLYVITG